MTHWMCTNCGYYFEGITPPDRCPDCKESCAFNNVSSYRPDIGEGNIDLRVAGFTVKSTAAVQSRERVVRMLPTLEAIPPVYIFGNLTEAQRQRIRSLERTEVYDANAIIFRQGAEANKLYLVEEGQAGLQYELPTGRHVPIAVVSAGGGFGWSALIRPYQFTATSVALCTTQVRTIERHALLSLMRNDPKMGLLIMQDVAEVIASRLRNLEAEVGRLVQGRR